MKEGSTASRSVVALLIVFIATTAWLILGDDSQEDRVDSESTVGKVAGSPSLERTPAALDEAGVRRSGLNPESTLGSETWLSEPDRDRDLHGIVLGADGRPYPGATIAVLLPVRQGMGSLDLARTASTKEVARTVTNLDGEFRIPLAAGRLYDLDARATALRAPLRKSCQAGEHVVLRLEYSAVLRGTVRVAESGDAVEGVGVRVFRPGGAGRRFKTATDADGRYFIDGLTSGDWYLEIQPQRYQSPDWDRLSVHPGGSLVRDFELQVGRSARGRVVDATTGAPIAGAEVSDSWVFRHVAHAGVDGTYVLPAAGAGDQDVEMVARAPGYGRLGISTKAGSEDFVRDFALLPSRAATGRVVHPNESPAAGVYVAAVATNFRTGSQQIDWCASATDADGRFRIENIRPDIGHALILRADGAGSRIYEFPEDELTTSVIEFGDLVLEPGGWLAGTVRGGTGFGLPDVVVEVKGWNEDRGQFRSPHDRELDTYVGTVEARTDDLGRFKIGNLAQGKYTVHVLHAGQRVKGPSGVQVYAGEGVEGLEIPLDTGGSISGVVVGVDGSSEAGARIALRSENASQPRRTRVQADAAGRFRFDDVPFGIYTVTAESDESWRRNTENKNLPLPVSVTGVEPGREDLRLELVVAAVLRGIVVDTSGAPVVGAQVRARDADEAQIDYTVTGKDGRFHFRLEAGVPVTLVAGPPRVMREFDGGLSGAVSERSTETARLESVLPGVAEVRMVVE